jgi:acetoin:2,6-dichlorophenolindophenol oxidoreductase subunit alpha
MHSTDTGTLTGADLGADQLLALYRSMRLIRHFEEVIGVCAERGEFKDPVHLYIGQEAVAVGVCSALRRDDYIFSGHRSHGHYLAKGGELNKIAAEIFVRETGCSKGRGGSMHLTAPDIGLMGTSALVGGGMGAGVGAALASTRLGQDRVAAIFFGDGAIEEGVFHEALNFAALYKLPVLFVCENNLYASHLPLVARQPRTRDLYKYAEPYQVAALQVDGNDVVAMRAVAVDAVERARTGGGPTFVEALTYRWRGHVGPGWDLEFQIRPREEVEAWVKRCPIERFSAHLQAEGVASGADFLRIDADVQDEVAAAIEFARQSPFPEVEELLKFVYAS